MNFELPEKGFVFWPVGCGDSTTVVVNDATVIQVDLHHIEKSEDDKDPRWPVLDYLVAQLPKKEGKRYLAAFVLTHLDQDHVKGFVELNERVHIGELWFTPRVFQELQDDDDMSDDAKGFCEEARRRMDKVLAGDARSGNNIRVIGWSELLKEETFADIPDEQKTIAGNEVTTLDGIDVSGDFRAFIHAPFKDDADGPRNRTSIGMQVTLRPGQHRTTGLLLGDLDHSPVKRIFELSDADDLEWNILLAPHHCSKSVMYEKQDGEYILDSDLVSAIDNAGATVRWIVSSSSPIPARNSPGDNPPHAKAKNRYQEMVEDGHFICTGEHPSEESTSPVVVLATPSGPAYEETSQKKVDSHKSNVPRAIDQGRGGDAPHSETVGFG